MNTLPVNINTQVQIKDNLDSLISQFLLSQDIKANSKKTYQRALKRFLNYLLDKGIQNPIREDILTYKGILESQGLSSLTISGYIVAIRRFFEWLESMRYYPNVAKNIKGAKRVRGFRKDPLTVGQIKELLSSIDITNLQGIRDYALLNLLIRTGLRTVEIIRANIGDMRQEGVWVQGKGRDSKDEFVLLTEKTLKPIMDYLKARGKTKDSDPLFVSLSDRNKNTKLTTRSIRRIAKEHLRDIGLDSGRLTAHSLRHTFATIALKNGAPIMQVKEAMRHTNIETTMIYTHTIDRISNGAERYINF